MASMSGRSRSTTAAYSWSRIAGMTHLFDALLVPSKRTLAARSLMVSRASRDDPYDRLLEMIYASGVRMVCDNFSALCGDRRLLY